MKADLAATATVVAAARAAEDDMTKTATSLGIDLDKPEKLSQSIGSGLSDEAKTGLSLALTALDDKIIHIRASFQQVEAERNKILADAKELAQIPSDNTPGAEAESKLGTTLEHIWDFTNSLLEFVPLTEELSKTVIRAIAGTDLVKDGVFKDIFDKENQVTDALLGAYKQTNDLMAALRKAARDRLKADWNNFRAVADVYRQELRTLHHNVEIVQDLVGKYLTNRKSGGAGDEQTRSLMTVYGAIDRANQTSVTAKQALDGKTTLNGRMLQGWTSQLVPLGSIADDFPAEPGTAHRPSVIYTKSGKNFAYTEAREIMELISSQLGEANHVVASAPRIEKLHTNWEDALRSKLRVN